MSDVFIGFGIVLIGPWVGTNDYIVAVGEGQDEDGHPKGEMLMLPHIRVREGCQDPTGDFRSPPPDPTRWEITVDGRCVWNVPKEGAGAWFSVMAMAMAVSAGRACFRPDAPRLDPFNTRIGSFEPEPESKPSLRIVRPKGSGEP